MFLQVAHASSRKEQHSLGPRKRGPHDALGGSGDVAAFPGRYVERRLRKEVMEI
jgi:hypothetical protein